MIYTCIHTCFHFWRAVKSFQPCWATLPILVVQSLHLCKYVWAFRLQLFYENSEFHNWARIRDPGKSSFTVRYWTGSCCFDVTFTAHFSPLLPSASTSPTWVDHNVAARKIRTQNCAWVLKHHHLLVDTAPLKVPENSRTFSLCSVNLSQFCLVYLFLLKGNFP